MKKTPALIQTILLAGFITIFFLLNLIVSDRSFSEQENRYLQMLPKFSFSELFSGKFTKKFETYVSDQFVLRDSWTSLKARAELLSGKDCNKDVFLCEDETLLEPYTAPEQSDLIFNLDAIKTLTESQPVPVYFALIPSSCEIWRDKLPDGAPNDSQKDVIDFAYDYVGAIPVDMYSGLSAHRQEPIYYRTDHHWTSLGAYYGYTALAKAMGLTPVPLTDYSERLVTDEFYGTAYSASGYSWVRPDAIHSYVEQGDARITNYPSGAPVAASLYDTSVLTSKDKYKYFYGGNSPLLTIDTGNEYAPSLLILRDSYMDSMSPFLFAHFSKIHILDLRYYRTSLKTYIAQNDIDNILVCYNVKNFSEDGNIFLAAN